jgi:hypothetical protein
MENISFVKQKSSMEKGETVMKKQNIPQND